MNRDQVNRLLTSCSLPDSCKDAGLKETNISWVLLTDNFAFKIKRPVKFSFLDFSTLEQREFFCREELELNKRLAPDMYLDVLPITRGMLSGKNTGDDGEVIDYAVRMRRMDSSKEMDILLKQNLVSEKQIDQLAKKIAHFHKKSKLVKDAFGTMGFQEMYADIRQLNPFIADNLGEEWVQLVDKCVEKSFEYLNEQRSFFNERIISGFFRDCHGDLNARNIFLYDDPVIFDCIEFDKELRQIDVLNDIAFLCMELDFFERNDLCGFFYNKYLKYSEQEAEPATWQLFQFYKSYRANVRAKVILLKAKNKDAVISPEELDEARRYLHLMADYWDKPEAS